MWRGRARPSPERTHLNFAATSACTRHACFTPSLRPLAHISIQSTFCNAGISREGACVFEGQVSPNIAFWLAHALAQSRAARSAATTTDHLSLNQPWLCNPFKTNFGTRYHRLGDPRAPCDSPRRCRSVSPAQGSARRGRQDLGHLRGILHQTHLHSD